MIGAGTVINPIVKIVTTVVILGAVYLFIVRPVLDTTEKVVDQSAAQFERSQREREELADRGRRVVLGFDYCAHGCRRRGSVGLQGPRALRASGLAWAPLWCPYDR